MLSPFFEKWGNYVHKFSDLLCIIEQCIINYFQSEKEHILKNKFEKYVQKHMECTVF